MSARPVVSDAGALPIEVELRTVAEADGSFTGLCTAAVPHIFGGMLIGQSLAIAQTSVESSRLPHSLHASFVDAGDGRMPIRYQLEETRSGGSFSSRRVVATQDGGVIFTLTASFQDEEDGPEYEVAPTPGVAGPEGLRYGRYSTRWFESRDIPATAASSPLHIRRAWFRARLPLPDSPALQAQGLAYMSDHGPTRAVRQPHAEHPGLERRRSLSLDHSVWFHGRRQVDDWILSEIHPVFTGGGRGLAIGSLRARDGTLLASIAQETLFRVPED